MEPQPVQLRPEGRTDPPATPRPKQESAGREYFTAKKARAGDLDPDAVVWVPLPAETAHSPDDAMEAAAKREDDAGKYEEGDTYMGGRPKFWTPEKDVRTIWR
jgi:hypothetical protein